LSVDGKVDAKIVEKAAEELGIGKDKANPVVS